MLRLNCFVFKLGRTQIGLVWVIPKLGGTLLEFVPPFHPVLADTVLRNSIEKALEQLCFLLVPPAKPQKKKKTWLIDQRIDSFLRKLKNLTMARLREIVTGNHGAVPILLLDFRHPWCSSRPAFRSWRYNGDTMDLHDTTEIWIG